MSGKNRRGAAVSGVSGDPGVPEALRRPILRRSWIVIMSALALALLSFWWLRPSQSSPQPSPSRAATSAGATPAPPPDSPEKLKVQILSIRPHDPESYTQGLVWHDGVLYESGGQYGKSSVRQVDPTTGEVKHRVDVPKELFAEGLALVGDRLIQLTWQENRALVYDRATFNKVKEFRYEGEGWGLCYDGKRLVMSDGSDRLTFRDPETFAPLGQVKVTLEGRPVAAINELECVDGQVWANVWLTDDILRIDPATGKVTARVDASGLLTPDERATAEVLNGIAWVPATQTFLITGKYWPKMFEVKFVPAG